MTLPNYGGGLKPIPLEWLSERARKNLDGLVDPNCERCGGRGILEGGFLCPCVDLKHDRSRSGPGNTEAGGVPGGSGGV